MLGSWEQMENELNRINLTPEIADEEVISSIRSIPRHFSAGLAVDLGGTCQSYPSLDSVVVGNSGMMYTSSGVVVGNTVDLLHSNTFCNVYVAGSPAFASGQLRIAIQDSDTDTSGTYTDPTSGLPQMPTSFSSGGVLILQSGGAGVSGGVLAAGSSGSFMASGFMAFAAFQRQHRFARLVVLSGGLWGGNLQGGFVSQYKTTGSGGGFSFSPGSGVVNV